MAPLGSIATSPLAAFTIPHTVLTTTRCSSRCVISPHLLPTFNSLGPLKDIGLTSTKLQISPTSILTSTHNIEALLYMFLLALQFGLQPILTQRFTPKTINRSSVVFFQDVVKFFMAAVMLFITGGWTDAISGKASFLEVALIHLFVTRLTHVALL